MLNTFKYHFYSHTQPTDGAEGSPRRSGEGTHGQR